MEINLDLLKQVRESADWFIGLPRKLVSAYMGTKEDCLNRRERIQKAKELAELREIGKTIQSLYFFKGKLLAWATQVQVDKDVESAQYIREIFSSVVANLDEIWVALSETPLSNSQLGAEVSLQLGKAKAIYETLSSLSDEAIIEDRAMLEILAHVEDMQESGRLLLMEVDEHRRRIDCTYG